MSSLLFFLGVRPSLCSGSLHHFSKLWVPHYTNVISVQCFLKFLSKSYCARLPGGRPGRTGEAVRAFPCVFWGDKTQTEVTAEEKAETARTGTGVEVQDLRKGFL